MYRVLGRISRFQRKHGSVQVKSRWAYAKRLNTELGRKIAGAVTGYAEENHADVIVFEYLEIKERYREDRENQEWVYLYNYYMAEKNVAESLITLDNYLNVKKISNFEKKLKKIEKHSDLELSETKRSGNCSSRA